MGRDFITCHIHHNAHNVTKRVTKLRCTRSRTPYTTRKWGSVAGAKNFRPLETFGPRSRKAQLLTSPYRQSDEHSSFGPRHPDQSSNVRKAPKLGFYILSAEIYISMEETEMSTDSPKKFRVVSQRVENGPRVWSEVFNKPAAKAWADILREDGHHSVELVECTLEA